MVEYKDRLKWAMDNKPVGPATIRDMSDALKISYQAVRKVVLGDTHAFTAINNDKAASYLHVNSRWLATGKGSPNIPHASGAHIAAEPNNSGWPAQSTAKHLDAWIGEAIRILEELNHEDRRAAVLNLRVFAASLHPPSNGHDLPVAA
jgi:hypothetical protein